MKSERGAPKQAPAVPPLDAGAGDGGGCSWFPGRGMRPSSSAAPTFSSALPSCWKADRGGLIALMQSEGGKTLDDALSELREAVDYCRYYAAEARRALSPQPMPGPTGESNELYYRGRGVFVCISPWNFPLAIFLGQVAAALVAGNAVVAKPAEQTPLAAVAAVRLMHQAGVPVSALHLVPG
jgi:RHH-type proline utilization regulon transcriptional repressor/proline dehydrogenase/delta 1-pyrroline-5-carboxylate dehydrogenase